MKKWVENANKKKEPKKEEGDDLFDEEPAKKPKKEEGDDLFDDGPTPPPQQKPKPEVKKKKKVIAKSILTFDVKIYDTETNLE